MVPAPIVLFVYNRPWHTRETITALKKNYLADTSDLIVFSDSPKSAAHADLVNEVRQYIRDIDGFKSITVVERTENLGLAQSIILGVTSVVNKYGHVIVLEDDLVTSPFFLQFMNEGLQRYKDDKDVASIHGYVYPIDDLPDTFFMRGADCWGWATWNDRWEKFEANGASLLEELKRKNITKRFDFNGGYPYMQMLEDQITGKNNSWAIRWHASVFLNNKLTLYPGKSLVLNIGNDGSGAHCGDTSDFSSDVSMHAVSVGNIAIEESVVAFTMFERYFKMQAGGVIKKIRRRLSRFVAWFSK